MTAIGADLGVVFDGAAERLYLVDEHGREVPVEQTLLLFLKLLGASGATGKVAFPITVTSQVDALVDGALEVVRTPHSLADLTRAAASDGVVFAGAVGGGYVFPEFLPAYDAVASLAKLLELLAREHDAAVGARRRAAAADADPPPARVPVGEEGPRHAGPERGALRARRRPHRRDQAARRARLGAGAPGSRRAGPAPLRRGEHRRRSPPSSSRRCATRVEAIMQGDGSAGPNEDEKPQAEVDPSGSLLLY